MYVFILLCTYSFGYFHVVVYVNVRPCLCRQNLMYVKHRMYCLYRFVCDHVTQPHSCVTIYRGTFKTKLELVLSICKGKGQPMTRLCGLGAETEV